MSKGQIQAKARQVDVLVGEILKYPDIARGESSRSKEEQKNIWDEIERVVNLAGPPEKTAFEWKKAWADKKKYIRKKLAQNLFQDKWDREKEWRFTETEAQIIKMCSLVPPVKRSGTRKRSNPYTSDDEEEGETSYNSVKAGSPTVAYEQDQVEEEYTTDCQISQVKRANNTKDDTTEFLEVEERPYQSQQQQDDNMKVMLTNMSRAMDRFAHRQKLIMDETKRHNAEMEKLRKLEIKNAMAQTEIKRKFYELELAKYKKENCQ